MFKGFSLGRAGRRAALFLCLMTIIVLGSDQSVPVMSAEKPTTAVWLMTVHP